ncbi:tyrosine-type recombinase/integrase [Frankia sp. Cj5]|uniref:tyrosine-type recombinase/integrase n=1 Tax=Frankia sp. Cj5 TaxID=2880978 RepID=UPI001EF5A598|nr:tyrosine-type recombinase/integrase [Frankia sp. Cj5]
MHTARSIDQDDVTRWVLVAEGDAVEVMPSRFLRHLQNRAMSPNTVKAYASDLCLFYRFLADRGMSYIEVGPAVMADFLDYLVHLPVRAPGKVQGLVLATHDERGPGHRRAASSVNRTFAAVSSFFEFAITVEEFRDENPVRMVADHARARVPDRHQPFMGRASRQRPVRRALKVKAARTLPRPMAASDLDALFNALRTKRDRAMFLLMLDGGLRPGEVLGLQIPDDIEYGRRRVRVRHRGDHPKGVRQKSRSERVVDLHDPRTLAAINDYVMNERPRDTGSPYLFLIGGKGRRRAEPLSYQALWRIFARHCDRLAIRTAWTTPHALRHTHATDMWESGMRELTLQKRLGHASPESTRLYTLVSDEQVLADYTKATRAVSRQGREGDDGTA